MSRFRSLVIRLGAPLVVLVGIAGALAARRAMALRNTIELLADSLKHGSGPLAVAVPFVPAYVDGRKIGSLDSLWLLRHEPRAVDSLRLVIDLAGWASEDPEVRSCRFQLVTFDPGEFTHALECASDTEGLVPFGRVAFVQGGDAPLWVSATELGCAPWTDRAGRECVGERIQEQVRRDVDRARDEIRHNVRVRVR